MKRLNLKGILKILRYLWSLPMVRKAVGWLIQAAVTWIIKRIKRKKKKEKE